MKHVARMMSPAAHPRSRGEHRSEPCTVSDCPGSSPLARGTRRRGRCLGGCRRLIPARAGNTGLLVVGHYRFPAHPRSRGEHLPPPRSSRHFRGSSPLARGTRLACLRAFASKRLIPARAGNTSPPRHVARPEGGSSPLARGTRLIAPNFSPPARLIPARAGNTWERALNNMRASAHPRSRGEHEAIVAGMFPPRGSSPLARGTRNLNTAGHANRRLIPARAGNTESVNFHGGGSSAHPRSRGEHLNTEPIASVTDGSSPLARGTRHTAFDTRLGLRLIPARAGNTKTAPEPPASTAAHPRSRGEHCA